MNLIFGRILASIRGATSKIDKHILITGIVLSAIIGSVALLFWVFNPSERSRKAYQTSTQKPPPPSPPSPPRSPGTPPSASPYTVLPNGVQNDASLFSLDKGGVDPTQPPPKSAATPAQGLPKQMSLPPVPDTVVSPTSPGSSRRPTSTAPPRIEVASDRFLFDNRSFEALKAAPVVAATESKSPDVVRNKFAPIGESVDLVLLDNFISSDSLEIDVVAGVWVPFEFQGNLILPMGTKILGKASKGKTRDTVFVTWNKAIFTNGKSIPLAAVACMPDGTTGLKGKLVGNVMAQAIAPVLFEAASGFLSTFENYVTTAGGMSPMSASGGLQLAPNLSNGGLQSGRGAFEKVSDLLAKDMEENKPYLVIGAGMRCKALLSSFLDTSGADYGK